MVYTCSLSFLKYHSYTFHLLVGAKERIVAVTVYISTVRVYSNTCAPLEQEEKDSVN